MSGRVRTGRRRAAEGDAYLLLGGIPSRPAWGWRAGWSWAPRTSSRDSSCSDRSLWERGGRSLGASGSSLVLELLLRRPSRCVDVPVPVGPRIPPAAVPAPGPAPAQACPRRPIRQLLAADPVLLRRRVGDGGGPDVLRALPVAPVVHLAGGGQVSQRSDSPGTWRSPAPCRSRSPCSGTSPSIAG